MTRAGPREGDTNCLRSQGREKKGLLTILVNLFRLPSVGDKLTCEIIKYNDPKPVKDIPAFINFPELRANGIRDALDSFSRFRCRR